MVKFLTFLNFYSGEGVKLNTMSYKSITVMYTVDVQNTCN